MKRTLIIQGHPDIDNDSIANKIIVDQIKELENVEIRHLAQLYPDFKIDIDAEQAALLEADAICFQFPFHWYSVPGILKEWIDQVLSCGFAYGSEGTKLHGKEFVLSITIGGPEESYCKEGYNIFTIAELLAPLEQTANLTGMKFNDPIYTHNMIYIPDVYNVKEEVEERAWDHANRLVKFIEDQSME